MNKPLILKKFKEFGLSLYEAKSYLSLLERDTLTVSEISKIAGIPRANAYEALEKLMSKGMCTSRAGHIKKYSASDPFLLQDKFLMKANQKMEIELESLNKKEKEILEKLKAAKEIDLLNLSKKERGILEKNKAAKENIGNIIKEIRPQYKRSRTNKDPLEYIEIIKDGYQIHKKYIQLIDESKEELLVFSKPPYSGPRERLEEQLKKQPREHGIVMKTIYEIPKDKEEREWLFKWAAITVKHGEGVRAIKELPMKMAIFDSRIVMFVLEDPISGETFLTTQVVKHRALAKTLKIIFETLWEKAQDYHILKD